MATVTIQSFDTFSEFTQAVIEHLADPKLVPVVHDMSDRMRTTRKRTEKSRTRRPVEHSVEYGVVCGMDHYLVLFIEPKDMGCGSGESVSALLDADDRWHWLKDDTE